MKVIFLDIDGVMNYQSYYEAGKTDLSYPLCEIAPDAMALLNYIIQETDAKIVISSTWRIGRKLDELTNIFRACGFKGEIIDKTPVCKCGLCKRGNEIQKWIDSNSELLGKPYHQYQSYAIIDDDSDMLLWQANNFFQCDTMSGLSPDIAHRIINHLKSFN